MTDPTPLEKLDLAVQDFFNSVDAESDTETLSGWVLGYQFSFIEDSGPTISPIVWGGSYAISEGLSPFAAAGLADHVNRVIHRVYSQSHDEDNE